jgi:hypothetical protein
LNNGAGGQGGGANGVGNTTAIAGTANTGGGGGGRTGTNVNGGNGGSGIVILRYLTADLNPSGLVSITGGTITTAGSYTVHTFTSTGTLTVS